MTTTSRRSLLAGCLAAPAVAALSAAAATTARPKKNVAPAGLDVPEMITLPPGVFLMGSSDEERARELVSDDRGRSEQPIQKVTITHTFAVSKYPVTRGQYAQFVADTNRPDPPFVWCMVEKIEPNTMMGHSYRREKVAGASWRNPGYEQANDNHPVVGLSWDDCNAYAAWLSKRTGEPFRLLSEAEWEYATRAGTQTSRFWGDEPERGEGFGKLPDLTYAEHFGFAKHPTRVFMFRSGYPTTAPVGTFKPNPFGLYDMLGNAGCWCEDVWYETHEGAPPDGSARVTGGDPTRRVCRNGHWNTFPSWVRAASRGGLPANENLAMMGTRVAKTIAKG